MKWRAGLFYVGSRYYDPVIGRFINADSEISGFGGDICGYNLYSYCFYNPVNMSDPLGHWPKWLKSLASAVVSTLKKAASAVANTVKSTVSSVVKPTSKVVKTNSNRLPKTGDLGSNKTLPNPDGTPKQKRWYGPDGMAERDRDYNHPGDMSFPHDYDWPNGERNKDHLPLDPSYEFSWKPVIGLGLVAVCAIGIVALAADDVTGIGVADDFFFGPLGAGVGKGIIMIFK